MNIPNTHPDELVRSIFAAIPFEEPSPEFTERLMKRLPAGHSINQPIVASPFNIGFRTAIALLLTVSFFIFLVFASNFDFTEWIFRISGTLLRDFSLNSLIYLTQNILAKILNTRFLSIIAGIVLLVGGSLMVLYRYSADNKGLSKAAMIFII